jgi:hypothetical protein
MPAPYQTPPAGTAAEAGYAGVLAVGPLRSGVFSERKGVPACEAGQTGVTGDGAAGGKAAHDFGAAPTAPVDLQVRQVSGLIGEETGERGEVSGPEVGAALAKGDMGEEEDEGNLDGDYSTWGSARPSTDDG